MTSADALAAALVERGLDAQERTAKAAMFERVLRTFAAHAGAEPQHAWWVPGRLEVFGKHTDYAGGRTIVCAVPRGFAVVARARRDGMLFVADAKRDEAFALDPTDDSSHRGWRHYVEVVARRFARNFPGAPLGADIVVESDLPRASGMSSSTALVVAIATALMQVGALRRHPNWQKNLDRPLDVASYLGCVENGLPFGTLEGDAGVGTHGGSEDHAAIVSAVPGQLSAFRFVPMRRLEDAPVPPDWRFVLSPCGVASQKTGGAMQQYNRLSEGTQLLLNLWNASEPPADSLSSALRGSADRALRLRGLIRGRTVAGWSPGELERRLDHFIREDARIPEAVRAFRTGDAAVIAALAAASQEDAEALLGNQIPETVALAHSARALGAFASCSFGAGFGGSVWALVERASAEAFARRWHGGAFVALPGPPLVELSDPAAGTL